MLLLLLLARERAAQRVDAHVARQPRPLGTSNSTSARRPRRSRAAPGDTGRRPPRSGRRRLLGEQRRRGACPGPAACGGSGGRPRRAARPRCRARCRRWPADAPAGLRRRPGWPRARRPRARPRRRRARRVRHQADHGLRRLERRGPARLATAVPGPGAAALEGDLAERRAQPLDQARRAHRPERLAQRVELVQAQRDDRHVAHLAPGSIAQTLAAERAARAARRRAPSRRRRWPSPPAAWRALSASTEHARCSDRRRLRAARSARSRRRARASRPAPASRAARG